MQKKYNKEVIEEVVSKAMDELEDLGFNDRGVNFLYKQVGDGLYQIPYKEGVLMTGKEGVRKFLQSVYDLTDEEANSLTI